MSTNCSNKYFEKILPEDNSERSTHNVTLLYTVLKRRLPRSSFMYNQIIAYKKEAIEEFTFYIFRSTENARNASDKPNENDDADEHLWILSKYKREDFGFVISISPPTASFNDTSLLPSVKFAIKNSDYIVWSQPFVFLTDPYVSDFVITYLTREIGNVIKIYPTYLFVMDPEDALKLDVSSAITSAVHLGSLEREQGSKFICSHWSMTSQGTEEYIQKSIERDITAGVVVKTEDQDGNGSKLVCTATVPAYGLLSTLVTHPNHRRKGYASLVEKFVLKQMAEQGYYPCLDATISDPGAVGFHKSIPGNKIACKLDYICHKAL